MLTVLPSSVVLAAPLYVMTDLGPLPVEFGWASGKGLNLNSSSTAAGFTNGAPPTEAAVATPNGVVETLGALIDGGWAFATGINESGVVTGYGAVAAGGHHAFVGSTSGLIDIGTLGTNSSALAINDSGHVTGESTTAAGERHAFYWNGASMLDLGTLGGDLSIGRGISNTGLVTGVAGTIGGDYHAALWSEGSVRDLGTLGGARSVGNAVSDNGLVTGFSYLPGRGSSAFAFLWKGDSMIPIPAIVHNGETNGNAVNSSGWVTGWARTASGGSHAFVWDGTTTVDLGALSSGYDYSEGWWISEDGRILGHSTGSDGQMHIVSWTVVPEPASLSLSGVAFAALAAMRRRLRKR